MFDKFIDKVYKSGVHDLKIVENFEVNDDDVDFDGEKIEDTITILNKYVEDSDFELDKERVKQLLRKSINKLARSNDVYPHNFWSRRMVHTQ